MFSKENLEETKGETLRDYCSSHKRVNDLITFVFQHFALKSKYQQWILVCILFKTLLSNNDHITKYNKVFLISTTILTE